MKEFTIKPFKSYIFLIPLSVLCCAMSVFILSTAFTSDAPLTAKAIQNLIFFCLYGILSVALGVFVWKASRKSITFTADGVSFAALIKQWSELPYIYTTYNARSFLHIILSPTPLSKDEIKKLMRKNELPPCRIIIEDRFIFPIDDAALQSIRKMLPSETIIKSV